jgi:hypothetical protein
MKAYKLLPLLLLLPACGQHDVHFDKLEVEGMVEHRVTLDPSVLTALSATFSGLCSGHADCIDHAMDDFFSRLQPASAGQPRGKKE